MQLSIVKVGNSKGLRLPKSILEEYHIQDAVELKLKEGFIELRPVKLPRQNWVDEFKGINSDTNEEERLPDFFEDEEK